MDAVYVENAAYAHFSLEKVAPDSAINGQLTLYYESRALETVISSMVFYLPRVYLVHQHVPASIAYGIGALLEFIYTFFRIKSELPMTRFVARQLATSHWFKKDKALKELGYIPKVSMKEVAWNG